MHGALRGYVLAGGQSSRMQGHGLPVDKASLIWQGRTLLERAITLLQTVCETQRVLCGTAERCARLQCEANGIVDHFMGMGPLSGLEAALSDAEQHGAGWALIVPVDLPYLTSNFLLAFISQALAQQASVCCLQEAGLTQPLPALVRVDSLPFVQRALVAGDRKLLIVLSRIARRLTPERGLTIVEASDLQCVGKSDRWFWNVNTPEDFLLLQQSETPKTVLHQNMHGQQ